MKRSIITILAAMQMIATVMAQSNTQSKINDIIQQSAIYYWERYTHTDAQKAEQNASRWLMHQVNSKIEESEKLPIEVVQPYMEYYFVKFDKRITCFAYVSKATADSLRKSMEAVPMARHIEETPTVSVINTMPVPSVMGSSVQSVIVSSVSATPAPSAPSVSTDDSVSVTTIVPVAVPTAVPATPQAHKPVAPDAFAKSIMEQKNFRSVYIFLREQKQKMIIQSFGSLKEVDDYSKLDLILIDRESLEIQCVLSAEDANGLRTNLISGASDSLNNYSDDTVSAIWYRR